MTAMAVVIDEFVQSADWLSPADQPAVATLRLIAAEIDGGDRSPALLAQLGLTYRSLLKREPTGGESDPVDDIIARGREGS